MTIRDELDRRMTRVREEMRERCLDMLLILPDE